MSVRASLVLLATGVLCLIAFALLGSGGFRASGADTPERLLAIEPGDVATITLRSGDITTGLVRTEDGWGLADRAGYPVFSERADRLLIELSELTVIEARTDEARFHERLGVHDPVGAEDAGTRITLADDEGDELADLVVGRLVEGRGLLGRLVRVAGEDRVWWVEPSLAASASRTDWLDLILTDVARNEIAQIRIAHGDGASVILTAPPGAIPGDVPMVVEDPANARSDHPALTRLPTALTRFRFLDVVPASSVEMPEGVVVETEFETTEGLVYLVRTIPVDERFSAATIEVFPLMEEAAAEASSLNERFAGWVYFIDERRASDMRLRPEDLRATSLEERLGPVIGG